MPTKPKAKRLPLYRAYTFKNGDKDPCIDVVHTALEDAGLDYTKAAELSGVSRSCIYNWIEGDTMRPQYCTVMAVMGACGLEQTWTKKARAAGSGIGVGHNSRPQPAHRRAD